MPQCRRCGAELGADDRVCASCGERVAGATESFEPVAAAAPSVSAVRDQEGPALVVTKGPQSGERFYLDRARLTIGRDPESDIFLNDMTVSRAHAVLENADGVVSIRDSSSLNGTYVNGRVVESAVLADGDVVQIGTFQMVFVAGRGGRS